ncbi:MAG: histidine kinase dimerization/phosphoacceptor domain -containing protein [Salibacteraceae bacterium]
MGKKHVTFLLMLLFISGLFAQNNFDAYIKQAHAYDKANLYPEEGEELLKAIEWAKSEGLEKEWIQASIDLSELARKTRDFQRGIDILNDLPHTEKYPKLHIRKMGRLAAIYNEYEVDPNDFGRFDSVTHYLNLAIPLAEKLGFKQEEASLKNELACFIQWTQGSRYALPLFEQSAKVFYEVGDTANYAVVVSHLFNCYLKLNDQTQANLKKSELIILIDGNDWPQISMNFYNLLKGEAKSKGDSLNYYKYSFMAQKSSNNHLVSSYSNKMASFRVLYDVEKYQSEMDKKERELIEEENRSRLMIIFISVLTLLFLGIWLLLFREKRLKRVLDITNNQLRSANDKYQTLLVESNHRIKNNLQMIISMFDYSAQVESNNPAAAFKRMSGKIQTVSALHKHLYLETHNENLNLEFYFTEILDLYKRLSKEHIEVNSEIFKEIEIPSERLVYFGLVFNEMIANTIEHHSNDQISVDINVQPKNNHYLFYYSDGSKFDDQKSSGTGSLLIEELINRVEGFNVKKDNTKGVYQFEFYG